MMHIFHAVYVILTQKKAFEKIVRPGEGREPLGQATFLKSCRSLQLRLWFSSKFEWNRIGSYDFLLVFWSFSEKNMRFSKKILTKAVQKALLENKRIRIFAFIFGQENQSKIHVGARPSPGSTTWRFGAFYWGPFASKALSKMKKKINPTFKIQRKHDGKTRQTNSKSSKIIHISKKNHQNIIQVFIKSLEFWDQISQGCVRTWRFGAFYWGPFASKALSKMKKKLTQLLKFKL